MGIINTFGLDAKVRLDTGQKVCRDCKTNQDVGRVDCVTGRLHGAISVALLACEEVLLDASCHVVHNRW
jgi:hypothetical protein